MIRCSVCGEWFEPYTPAYPMYAGQEDKNTMCYSCLESIDSALYDDYRRWIDEN